MPKAPSVAVKPGGRSIGRVAGAGGAILAPAATPFERSTADHCALRESGGGAEAGAIQVY